MTASGGRQPPEQTDDTATLVAGSLRHAFWRPGRISITFADAEPIVVRVTMDEMATWEDGGSPCRFDYGSRDLHRDGAWLATLPRQKWEVEEYRGPAVEVRGEAWPLEEERPGPRGPGPTLTLFRPSEPAELLLRIGRGFWGLFLPRGRRFEHAADLTPAERAVCVAVLTDRALSFRG